MRQAFFMWERLYATGLSQGGEGWGLLAFDYLSAAVILRYGLRPTQDERFS
jgi:hypothetical protein